MYKKINENSSKKINTININKSKMRFKENRIYIENIGNIKVLPKIKKYNILNIRIIKNNINEYYLYITIEKKLECIEKTNKAIGIDLGIINFCILSNGQKISNPNFYKLEEEKIKRLQRIRSKKIYKSNNYKKITIKINKIYKNIKNKENNFLHVLSKALIKKYDIICIEDLVIPELLKHSNCKKSINYVCWKKFVKMLEYKAKIYNKEIIKVGKYFKSTKLCSYCKTENKIDSLSIRDFRCKECNRILDRDINAARNILYEGLRIKNIKYKI